MIPDKTPATPLKTILLVEDEALFAMYEKALLQKHGFRVLAAASGAAAVEIALTTPELDLILMDLTLETELDGADAARQILQQRELPIVFLSCQTEPEIVAKTEQITSYGYVGKNSGETVLLASLNMAFKLFAAHQQLKTQQARLQEREQQLLRTEQMGHVGHWDWDVANETLTWSAELYAIFGVTSAFPLTYESIAARLHPEDRAYNQQQMQALLHSADRITYELRIVRPDGGLRHLLQTAAVTRDAHGQATKIFGIMQDITDRKQAEEALRQSEARLSLIYNTVNEYLVFLKVTDAQKYVIESCNTPFIKANQDAGVPVTLEQLTGLSVTSFLRDLVKSDQAKIELILQKYAEALATKRLVQYDEATRFPDGAIIYTETTLIPIMDNLGQCTHLLYVARDITDRKRVEEALRESEERFRIIADYTYDWESWYDANGQVCWINPMVAWHTGYSVAECLTMPAYPLPIIAPEDQAQIGTLLQDALRERTSGNDVPFRFRRKDLTTGWMAISWQPVYNAQDVYIGIRSSIRDISDRKRAEEALRESERRLLELNANKDKFFTILAHDLKNPLISFLSFATLLEEGFEGRPAAERTRLIQSFRASAETLFALLENLLTWSQLQRGVMTYSPQPLVLNWIVARNVELFTPQAVQKQITLTQAVSAISVQGDFNMVDAVIRNLLSNAIKFTLPGGAVEITATHTADKVAICVADTGIGMSADYLTQVFQIEAKTQRTGTAGEKGTGLGLVLCREFAARHGGRLSVASQVGQGTTVTLTLSKMPTDEPQYR